MSWRVDIIYGYVLFDGWVLWQVVGFGCLWRLLCYLVEVCLCALPEDVVVLCGFGVLVRQKVWLCVRMLRWMFAFGGCLGLVFFVGFVSLWWVLEVVIKLLLVGVRCFDVCAWFG